MTSRLSSDLISDLVPLVGSIARLIAREADVSIEQLEILLGAVDIGGTPEIEVELQRWVELLLRAHQTTDERIHRAIEEALRLRGLPGATVSLAVSTVSLTNPMMKGTITVSVDRLDFGTLETGQGATASIEVLGGPGHILVESDQVIVNPQEFEAGVTRLKVECIPWLSSGTLWTSIKLVTASEKRDIPVLAQWVKPIEKETHDASLERHVSSQGIEPSRKPLLPNPWSLVDGKYSVDQLVEGRITRIVDYGAFAEIEPGVEGLLHVSQLSRGNVERVDEIVHEGETHLLRIISLDTRQRHIGLSLRAVTAAEQIEWMAQQDLAAKEPLTIEIDPYTGKYIGTLKWYNASRGYGFIFRGGGEEIFFHRTNLLIEPTELEEGRRLLYDVEEGTKGLEATDVEPYESEPPARRTRRW